MRNHFCVRGFNLIKGNVLRRSTKGFCKEGERAEEQVLQGAAEGACLV